MYLKNLAHGFVVFFLRLAGIRKRSNRLPVMPDSLRLLRDCDIEINVVLDVGIYKETRPLMEAFPDVEHHLFEPVDIHFKDIRSNYSKIKHVIHHVALSNKDGSAYLACKSINNTGEVTHSEVLSQKPDDESQYVKVRQIRMAKLDTIIKQSIVSPPYLLKIDVDGHELPIMEGAVDVLENTSVVIVEAPLQKNDASAFFLRSQFLLSRGFYLVDIVDMAYYNDVLWQVDLVFVKKHIIENVSRLRPFECDPFVFDKHKWNLLSDRL